jgi:hypothetical protein
MINPSVPSETDVVLGDGVLYKDYGLATQREIGACSGDSKFSIAKKFNHVDYNGQYGDTKGLKYVTKSQPQLTINLLSISPQNLSDCFAGLTLTDQATYVEVSESLTITSSMYWTNLTFIGERKDGKDVFIQLDNVLGDQEKIDMALKTDNHLIVDCLFTAHYADNTPTTPPWRMRYFKT